MQKAIAYYRTSSAANVGEDKDLDAAAGRGRGVRQVGGVRGCRPSFNDAAVSGADALDARPGFAEALGGSRQTACGQSSWRRRAASPVILSSPRRDSGAYAKPGSRSLRRTLQIHPRRYANERLHPSSAGGRARARPGHDGSEATRRKATQAATGAKVEGRKSYSEAVPATVDRAKALKAEGLTLRKVTERLAAEGHRTGAGTPYQFTAVGRMIAGRTR